MNKYYMRYEEVLPDNSIRLGYIPLIKNFVPIDGSLDDILTPPGFEPNGVDEFIMYDHITERGYLIAKDANGNPMYDGNGNPIHTGQVV